MLEKINQKITKIQNNGWYALLMVALALLSIGLLGYELLYPGISPETRKLVQEIDLIIAYVFLTDFFLGFIFSIRWLGKKTYFKDNWLNLASSIPISTDFFRTLRLLRILRALRIIRVFMNLRFAEKRHHQAIENNKKLD